MFLWESPVCILCWLFPCELSIPLISTQKTGGAGLTGLAFWRAVSGFYLIFVIIITHHEFCFSHLQALMRYEKSRQSSTCYFCAITNKLLTWHHYRAEKILENDEVSFMSSSLKTNVKSCYLDLHILNSGEGRKKAEKCRGFFFFFYIKVGIQNMSSNSSMQFFFSYERWW